MAGKGRLPRARGDGQPVTWSPCAVAKPWMSLDLLVYARRSCSLASSTCSWSGCSAGWRSWPAATPPRTRRSFSPRTGLPDAEVTGDEAVTWYARACAYTEAKWANLAPVSRRSVAEALASRGPRRIADLAGALDVAPSTAGRMGDRLVRKGLVRRRRARGDRRVVLVSVTPAGRQVVDEATRRRRALIAGILARLPAEAQRAGAGAFREFADAADEIPDSKWPAAVPPARDPCRAGEPRLTQAGKDSRPRPPAAVRT